MKRNNYQVQSAAGVLLDVDYYSVDSLKHKRVKGLVQILHGMQEHKGRYKDFASYLAGQGYAVVIHDHLGHGKSTSFEHPLGDMVGFEYVLRDVHRVRKSVSAFKEIEGILDELPYFLIGHSMGSFIARTYASKEKIDYLVLSGTGQPSKLGNLLMKLMLKFSKGGKPLPHIQKLISLQLTKGFHPPLQWLSYNEENYTLFIQDSLCGFDFTKEGYKTLSDFIDYIHRQESFHYCSAKEILMISGVDDPLGDFTKGVEYVANRYQKVGKNISTIFYEHMTHEILNETDKEKVYTDILTFLERISLCTN